MNVTTFISSKISGKENTNKFIGFAKSVAVISVMLGTTALIVSLSILNGFDKALRENAVKFTSHITVKSFDRKELQDYPSSIKKINRAFPGVTGVEPVIEGECLFRAGDNVEGMLLRGILPDKDITGFSDKIVEGSYDFSSDSAKEMIVSRSIARRMNLNIGDEAVIFAVKIADNFNIPFPKVSKVKLSGIYETGMSQYDETVIFVPYRLAGKLFDIKQGDVTKYYVNINDIQAVNQIADSLDVVLGYPHFAITVFDIHRAIFSWIELQKEPIPIVLGLISIVAVLNIITTLLILVVEKTNTIGVLRSLGMRRIGILKIFVAQGMRLGLIGTGLGVLLALSFSLLQHHFGFIRLSGELYFLDRLPIDISLSYYVMVIAISLLLTFTATFLPAFVAVRISPLRAIRLK